MSSRQAFVEVFTMLADRQSDWEWGRYSKPGDDVRWFVAPLESFRTIFREANPDPEDEAERHNSGPTLDAILDEPLVRKVAGYIVTGCRDARVTLNTVYIDATVSIDPYSQVMEWVKTANGNVVEDSLCRLWWD